MIVAKTIDKQITATEKWITLQYQQALRETRSKLATIFEKYSVDGKLSYVDMAKYNRLTQLENELVTVFGETQTKINATLSRVPENVYKDTFSLNAYNI